MLTFCTYLSTTMWLGARLGLWQLQVVTWTALAKWLGLCARAKKREREEQEKTEQD